MTESATIKRKPHTDLKNRYPGKDIYVLGAGKSMEFVDPSFFEGKITIGANSIWKYFPVTHVVLKHEQFIQAAIDAGCNTIISAHDCGDIDKGLNKYPGADYVFTHKYGKFGDREKHLEENLAAVGNDDDIFVSYSTITSCVHLAAFMGTKNIVICGHDCGYIDGETHLKDYADHIKAFHKTESALNECHNEWFDLINEDSIKLKKRLVEAYGCNIYSLSPFINPRMDGHVYDTQKS